MRPYVYGVFSMKKTICILFISFIVGCAGKTEVVTGMTQTDDQEKKQEVAVEAPQASEQQPTEEGIVETPQAAAQQPTEEGIVETPLTASPVQKKDGKSDRQQALELVDISYDNLMQQKWIEAISTTSAAIDIDPNLPSAYVNRAWAYIKRGMLGKAILDCNKAIEIDENYAVAYNNRGLAYHNLGEEEEALRNYRKACELGLSLACENYKENTGHYPSEEKDSSEK